MYCIPERVNIRQFHITLRFILPVLLMLFMFSIQTGTAHSKNAPDEARIPSFEISEKATEIVSPLDRNFLSKDNLFLETLVNILRKKDLSEAEKTDAFYLMLKKIKWEFTGTVRLPPRYTYFRIFRGTASTFIMYQRSLQALKYNVNGMLDIVQGDCNNNVVRCSNALLLAAMLNPEASEKVVGKLINPAKLEESQVPPILVHHLSLAVVLCRKYRMAVELGDITLKIPSEESQEDILCALGMFNSRLTESKIKMFLNKAVNEKFDGAVQTGLLILFERLDNQEFEIFYSDLIDSAKDLELKHTLSEYNDAKIKEGALGGSKSKGWVKIWDGYNVVVYDDGLQITYGNEFSNFIEF